MPLSTRSCISRKAVAAEVLEIIDKWAATVDDDVLSKMDDVFIEAAWFEYAFWDYGYTGDDNTTIGNAK